MQNILNAEIASTRLLYKAERRRVWRVSRPVDEKKPSFELDQLAEEEKRNYRERERGREQSRAEKDELTAATAVVAAASACSEPDYAQRAAPLAKVHGHKASAFSLIEPIKSIDKRAKNSHRCGTGPK
ncbi:ribonuclease, Rne/Rng family protein [Trichinella spiralis]|uniref:ribonuclease, Rne/Rng family protein n=1 Tax=Trichinella spiralis TaxID=6334 RepID=UPI0001EFB2E2|nr:ribonuclease, Rne/Rng family protein [Trichinella spiralis]